MGDTQTASLSIRVTQEGATATAAALHGVSQAGAAADHSVKDLALRIAGLSTGFNLAVQVGQKIVQVLSDTAKESVVLAAGFEKSRITWGVLVGDMDKGSIVFEKIRAFANKTPLSFEGLNQAATTVKGFGVATNDIIPVLSKLGDVAMGDNNKLQSLALVYGQVMAQGKAKTQDLYQFINAGVPIFNLLAQSMNVSAGEIKTLAAEGAITFQEIEKAINKATSEGGQFYGMMDKTSESTSGKWSTAMDNWKSILADIGTNVLPLINKGLDDFNTKAERAFAKQNIIKVLGGDGGDAATAASDAYSQLNEERGKLSGLYGDQLARQENIVKRAEALYQQLARIQASSIDITGKSLPPILPPPETPYKGVTSGGLSLEYRDAYYAEMHPGSVANAILTPDEMNRLGGTTSYNASMFGNLWGPSQNGQWQDNSAFTEASGSGMGAIAPSFDEIANKITKAEQAAQKFNHSVYAIGDALSGIAEQGFVDSFKSLGEAWASGADGADSLGSSIANIGATILDQMPMLLLQAGLSAVIAGQWILGAGLVAASGLVAIGSGVADYYSGDTANAMGGVYNSPSLHSYVNGVYDSPRHFAFAQGGVFGEAGPEAIMPLARTSGGALGVRTTGGSVSVSVVNNLGVEASASVEQTTGADGSKQIKILLEKAIAETLASGKADKALGSRYGLQAQGRRVQ